MRPRSAKLTSSRRRALRAAAMAALAFTLTAPLRAQVGFEAGLDAYLRGDYAAARAHWERLAHTGHAQSAFNLGRMHELGQGMPVDDGGAAAWFRLAAERGHPGAQQALGQILAEGRGGLDDPLEAYLWLALAARQAAPGSAGARLLALQLDGVRRRLTPAALADAEAAVANWSPRRD